MTNKHARRTALRGWWRGLPFLIPSFVMMFTFAWLEAQRLNNEYRAHDLTQEIWRVRADIERLQGQHHHLKRMERLERQASELALVEANPEQIVVIEVPGDHQALRELRPQRVATGAHTPTRSVIFRLGPPRKSRHGLSQDVARRPGPSEAPLEHDTDS